MDGNYDIFISYAKETDLVMAQFIFERLNECRLRGSGAKPRIFFDRDSNTGLTTGGDYRRQLFNAIKGCGKFLAIYSKGYFESHYCTWEWSIAMGRNDDMGEKLIFPINVDGCDVPDAYGHIQYIRCEADVASCFSRLFAALGFDHVGSTPMQLIFSTQPSRVQVNATLPLVRIEFQDANGAVQQVSDKVTLTADPGSLQGETVRLAKNGVVDFQDLSFNEPIEAVCLVASAEGMQPIRSSPFTVSALERAGTPSESISEIDDHGWPVFFADDEAIALFRDGGVRTFDLGSGQPLLDTLLPIKGPVRLVVRGPTALAVCDWEGHLHILSREDPPASRDLTAGTGDGSRIDIIGAVCFDEADVCVGLWRGDVFRFGAGEVQDRVVKRPQGVQALAVAGAEIALVDLDGTLAIYRDGQCVREEALEPRVRLLKRYPDHLVAVGVNRLYQIPLDDGPVIRDEVLLTNTTSVYGDCAVPVAIDEDGKGVRFDDELQPRGIFHVAPGARPIGADDSGQHCVLQLPDGTHVLGSRDEDSFRVRVAWSHEGPLGIDSRGERLAVSDDQRTYFVDPRQVGTRDT